MGAIQSALNSTLGTIAQSVSINKALKTQSEQAALEKEKAMNSLLERVSTHTGQERGFQLYQTRVAEKKLKESGSLTEAQESGLLKNAQMIESSSGTRAQDYANLLESIVYKTPYSPMVKTPAGEDEGKEFIYPGEDR